MATEFKILSIDGGGLKGVFAASFLAALEETTGKHIAEYFDLIAGTSTGGIIALGLGLGFSPNELLEFYQVYGGDIFPAQQKLARMTRFIRRAVHVKYSDVALNKALKANFKDYRLGDSSVKLVIPAYDALRGDVYIYKTPHHKNLKTDYEEFAWKVARATSAAPTFLPMYVGDTGVRLIDGGIWANNPCMVALAEALGYLQQKPADVRVLSIGTTQSPQTTGKRHINGGIAAWAQQAVKFMLAGQSQAALNQCAHILGRDENSVIRVNPDVPPIYGLDVLSQELIGLGTSEARQHVNSIDEIFLAAKAAEYVPVYTPSCRT